MFDFNAVWEVQSSLHWLRFQKRMLISKTIQQGNNVLFAGRGLIRLFTGCACTIENSYGFVYFQSLKGPVCNPISLPLVYFA